MQQPAGHRSTPTVAGSAPRFGRRPVLCRPVMLRSMAVALVVGTVLNMINQGDALLAGHAVNWLKVVLTYCVPFLVATYGAHCALRMAPRVPRS